MIFIGDVATNKYNPNHSVNTIEILYLDEEELNYILTKYNLKNPTVDYPYYKEYKNKNNKLFKLYSLECDKVMTKLSKDVFNKKRGTVIANPFINFVFDCCRVVKVHSRFDEWINRMESYAFLADNYIEELVSLNKKYDNLIDRYFKMLRNFKDLEKYTNGPYKYSSLPVNISKYELLEIVTTVAINRSALYRIMGSTKEMEEYNKDIFINLSYQEAIDAVMECLYIDVLKEYVIPTISKLKRQPTDEEVERQFHKAMMWRASQVKDDFISGFVINNYYVILGEYDSGFYRAFCNSLKNGDITIPLSQSSEITSRHSID